MLLSLPLLNGVFSGAEIAILSIRRTRLQELAENGSGAAVAVSDLRANPERFLATVQVGITVVGATNAAFGGAAVAARISPLIAAVPPLAPFADRIALFLVVALVSYLSLVLGELVPKSLALRAGESYALLIGRPLSLLAWVARPLVWVLTTSSNLVLRLFGDSTSFVESRLSPEELRQLVEEASAGGTIDPKAGEIAARALDFADLNAKDIMVPRNRIAAVSRDVSLKDFVAAATDRGHARLLVHNGDLEDVAGFVVVRDVLAQSIGQETFSLEPFVHAIHFVPATAKAPAVLKELQQKQLHLAVVVDEQGSLRGLITLEELLEELVGEIFSEGDAPEVGAKRESDGAILAAASTPIHEINRMFHLELPEEDTFSTLGGLCTITAERIPSKGTTLRIDGYTLEVVDATPRRVKTVRVRTVA